MTPGTTPPVGRLAPSPTGPLHAGHARTFLMAWWHVRSRGGKIVLRIEDLDADRVRPGMIEACERDLAWLGLDWDGAVEVQSADTSALAEAMARLELDGRLYPCVCSRGDIRRALSAPHATDGETPYPGTCRGRYSSVAEAERETGKPAGLRFRVEPGRLALHDRFHGPFESNVAQECGDFLVARRDGRYGYHLAVVVDDARAGVTEVLRGDDLLGSTGRQWLLQEALGLPHPDWVHVPLVVDADGRRLAKRSDALALAALRDQGVDPRAVVAWAARSCGLDVGDRVEAREVLAAFDLDRVPRGVADEPGDLIRPEPGGLVGRSERKNQ